MSIQAPREVGLTYVPRKQFQSFHARHQSLAILVYHRRAGKTVATVNDLVAKAMRCRKKNPFFAYVAPFMGQAKQVAWKYLLDAVRIIPGHRINKSETSVEVPSAHGSMATIRLFGADNENALRGLYFDGVVMDEVADMSKTVWEEVIQPALADRDGWVVFIGTPKGKNMFYDLWQEAQQKPELWFSQLLKASESGLLPKQKLEQIRERMDPESYEQEFECSFLAGIKGSYYATQINEMGKDGRLQPFEHVHFSPVHAAFDLGYSDSTVAWFFQIVNGRLDVVGHYEVNGLSMPMIVEEIREMHKKNKWQMGDWYMPHDAMSHSLQTGKTIMEQLWGLGINPKPVPNVEVQHGIQAVRKTLPLIRINGQACYQGLEALKAYQKKWNDKLGVFSRAPLHDKSSHSADAFRYLCLAISDFKIELSKPTESGSLNKDTVGQSDEDYSTKSFSNRDIRQLVKRPASQRSLSTYDFY